MGKDIFAELYSPIGICLDSIELRRPAMIEERMRTVKVEFGGGQNPQKSKASKSWHDWSADCRPVPFAHNVKIKRAASAMLDHSTLFSPLQFPLLCYVPLSQTWHRQICPPCSMPRPRILRCCLQLNATWDPRISKFIWNPIYGRQDRMGST